MNPFIKGISRTLDLGATMDGNIAQNDAEALASDWQAVSGDLQSAMGAAPPYARTSSGTPEQIARVRRKMKQLRALESFTDAIARLLYRIGAFFIRLLP